MKKAQATNPPSNPRATMRALLQPKLRVGLSGPGRHIAKRTNRINRLIWINPIDELMKVHISSGFIAPHAGVPGNRGY
jgi:xanthine dehydrogenase iron-sulfur cluster and FAD-binding subunit A